jgi:anaerobic ribonucleoside-triphosphate reductase activating protein
MKVRIAGIVNDSIVDGEGIRLTIFFQGCPHRCKGCHNPQTWDANGGYEIDTEEIIQMMDENPLLDGITLSGGEPFLHRVAALELAKAAHERNLSVWCYTGYEYDVHLGYSLKTSPKSTISMFLEEIDVLIDGKFIEEEKTFDLPWRGSKNQRLLYLYKGEIDGEG